jgi:hypothetical protein
MALNYARRTRGSLLGFAKIKIELSTQIAPHGV